MRVEILTTSGAIIHYDTTILKQVEGVTAAVEAFGGIVVKTEIQIEEPSA